MSEYLTLKELAEYSKLSQSTLRKYLKEIPHRRIGRKIVVKRSDYDRWLRIQESAHERLSPFSKRFIDRLLKKIGDAA